MTKEEIQEEYNKLTAVFGEKVYRAFIPLLEIVSCGQRLMHLNQEMFRIRQEETQACQAKLKAVDTK